MAIQLKLDYSKKLGLPQYSSHQFSVSLTSEVNDVAQIPAEVERIYRVLQDAVDAQIVEPGFVPGEDVPAPFKPYAASASEADSCDWKWPRSITPAFLRLPKKKTLCPYSGLSRSMMDSLVRASASNNYRPPVRSSKVKHSGVKGRRGAVLVEAESLFNYLASLSRSEWSE